MADDELHLDLDALNDFLVDGAGQPLTITVDRPLAPANAGLMAFLGVRVTVTAPIAICLVGGCDWRWDGEGDRSAVIEQHRVDEHDYIPRSRFSVRTSLNGVDGYDELDQAVLETRDCATPRCDREADNGSDFCRVCDEGLRIAAERVGHVTTPIDAFAERAREPKPEEEVETVAARRQWTRETIVEAIQKFAAEHGRPPKADEWVRSSLDNPTQSTVYLKFGNWGDAIVAAGFERPVRGGKRGNANAAKRSSVREPKAREVAVVLTGTPPAASSSSPLPESDAAVVDESPGPVAAEAGSPTDEQLGYPAASHHDWLLSLGLNGEMLRDEIARLDELSVACATRRDALQEFLDALEAA